MRLSPACSKESGEGRSVLGSLRFLLFKYRTLTRCGIRLDARRFSVQYACHWAMTKKERAVFDRIRGARGLSLDEKWLFAKFLAASPDERWRMSENYRRSAASARPLSRRASASRLSG